MFETISFFPFIDRTAKVSTDCIPACSLSMATILFNETLILSTDNRKKIRISNFIKVRAVGAMSFHSNGQTLNLLLRKCSFVCVIICFILSSVIVTCLDYLEIVLQVLNNTRQICYCIDVHACNGIQFLCYLIRHRINSVLLAHL
jgi:hypothetical protein